MDNKTASAKLASFDTIHLIDELKYRIATGELNSFPTDLNIYIPQTPNPITKLAEEIWSLKDYTVAILPKKESDVKEGYILGFDDGYNQCLRDYMDWIREKMNNQIKSVSQKL